MNPPIDTAKNSRMPFRIPGLFSRYRDLKVLDKKTRQRLKDIDKFAKADKQNILYTLDGLIKAAKLKAI